MPVTVEFLARNVLKACWDAQAASETRERVGSWLSRATSDLQGQMSSFQGPGNSDHIWKKHAVVQGWLAKWESFVADQPQNATHQPMLSYLMELIDAGTMKMDEVEADRDRDQARAAADLAEVQAAKQEARAAALAYLQTPPDPHEYLEQVAPHFVGVDAGAENYFADYADFCSQVAGWTGRRDVEEGRAELQARPSTNADYEQGQASSRPG